MKDFSNPAWGWPRWTSLWINNVLGCRRRKGDKVEASAGDVYFHNTSGQRQGNRFLTTRPPLLLSTFLSAHWIRHLMTIWPKSLISSRSVTKQGWPTLSLTFALLDLAMGSGHFSYSGHRPHRAEDGGILEEDGHQNSWRGKGDPPPRKCGEGGDG